MFPKFLNPNCVVWPLIQKLFLVNELCSALPRDTAVVRDQNIFAFVWEISSKPRLQDPSHTQILE